MVNWEDIVGKEISCTFLNVTIDKTYIFYGTLKGSKNSKYYFLFSDDLRFNGAEPIELSPREKGYKYSYAININIGYLKNIKILNPTVPIYELW